MISEILLGHGTKNSFLVLLTDGKNSLRYSHVVKLCSLPGLKVDGLVQIHLSQRSLPQWKFWNPDGSRARFCGNAARLGLAVLANRGDSSFSCALGEIRNANKAIFDSQAWNSGRDISICATWDQHWEKISIQNLRDGKLLNLGNPHLIIESAPNLKRAQRLRKKYNANVTFGQRVGSNLRAITFERGVENFTESCGTGALAASLVFHCQKVEMPGGSLHLKWCPGSISLEGPVQLVGHIQIPSQLARHL
ncbi:MAG: hypothetical protein WCH11_01605 [Bdellovibrio sp.]